MTMRLLHINGVRPDGQWQTPPCAAPALLEQVRAATPLDGLARAEAPCALPSATVDLAEAGWAVVFPAGVDDGRRAALEPLLARRRAEAGARYAELSWPRGASLAQFVAELATPPRFLLLAAHPGEIDFAAQQALADHFAVGRVAFGTPEGWARYAAGVVAAETGRAAAERTLAWCAPSADPLGQATEINFVAPLAARASRRKAWQSARWLGPMAERRRFERALASPQPPALFMCATHGLDDGALLTQDWTPNSPVGPQHRFGAGDVPDDARVDGLVAVLVASQAAGTLHPEPRLSPLAERLLGHPGGGALAVLAPVGRLWGTRFQWPGLVQVRAQRAGFTATLDALFEGHRVGQAALRLAEHRAKVVADVRARLERGADTPEATEALALLWTAAADARAMVLLGDPAVRILGTHAPARAPAPEPAATPAPKPAPASTPAPTASSAGLAPHARVIETRQAGQAATTRLHPDGRIETELSAEPAATLVEAHLALVRAALAGR